MKYLFGFFGFSAIACFIAAAWTPDPISGHWGLTGLILLAPMVAFGIITAESLI